MTKAQIDAVDACIVILRALGDDGDVVYETLANLNYNWFIRCGWEQGWPAFAAHVERGMSQRHLMNEPGGSA